jgi:hypothetical protein
MTTVVHEKQQPLPKSLQNGFVVFDLEWDPYTADNEILLAASFVDNHGKRTVLLIENYYHKSKDKQNPKEEAEIYLIADIIDNLKIYEYSFAWYSTGHKDSKIGGVNSDLVMIDKRIKTHGFNSNPV